LYLVAYVNFLLNEYDDDDDDNSIVAVQKQKNLLMRMWGRVLLNSPNTSKSDRGSDSLGGAALW